MFTVIKKRFEDLKDDVMNPQFMQTYERLLEFEQDMIRRYEEKKTETEDKKIYLENDTQ